VTKLYKRGPKAPDHSTPEGYEAAVLYNGESATIIGSTVRSKGRAPGHHIHEFSDQLYYVIQGEMHIQLGADVHRAGPGTLVYIPKGTPHHNWNEGEVDEFHFEVLTPAPLVTQPGATASDLTEAPGGHFLRTVEDVGFTTMMEGFSISRLVDRTDGAEVMLYLGQVEPGGAGPATHVHRFDQFYYVLEGELTVEVALEKFVAGPGELVVLPAGVPHRQWNEGSAAERHLTLLSPEPIDDPEWDVPVTFEVRPR
jgi:quercetin dioxygenase-like cupin family protein